MQRLKYINALGAELEFASSAPYIFWKLDGLGLPTVNITRSEAPGRDGYILRGTSFDSRLLRLSGHVHGKAGIEAMYRLRRELLNVCSPALGPGVLIYENDSGVWRIEALCTSSPYTNKSRNYTSLELDFECPAPYWLSDELYTVELTTGDTAEINNEGGGRLPFELELTGGAPGSRLANNTTGEYIGLSKALPQGGVLYINTDTLDTELITQGGRTNAYGFLTLGSTHFTLEPGGNVIALSGGGTAKITYRTRYAGV